MPARRRYNSREGRYETIVSCGRCNESRTVVHPAGAWRLHDRDEEVHTWIRWLNGPQRYHSRCRACEAVERRERVAANGSNNAAAPQSGDRRFGVELELIFPRGTSQLAIATALTNAGLHCAYGYSADRTGWRVKSDGSLRGGEGWEVVSPPLAGREGLDQIRTACRVLSDLGGKPNNSCGMHVHHEVRDLSLPSVKRFIHSWAANQDLLDGLVSPSRRGNHQYIGRLRDDEMARIDGLRSLRGYLSGIERYRNVNLNAYARYGTIEIRQHQGTVDAEKVCSWILLVQAMIASSRREPLPTAESVRDLLVEKLGRTLDATARTFLLGRAVEFGFARVI